MKKTKTKNELIFTNPDGVIYKLAQKRLSETTFPSRVKKKRKISKKDLIITNPDGVIYKLAQKMLSGTTFPNGVKNPLPCKKNKK